MFKKRFAPKAGAMAMAAMMIMSCGVPAMAAGQTYTSVSGTNAVIFEKYLTMNKEANVPNVTFNYTIAAGAAQSANTANQTMQVFAGNDANKVVGAPTIAADQAKFQVGDTTYDSVQDSSSAMQAQHTDGTNPLKDNLTLAANKKYARKDVKVDFSGVQFKEPGIYRYVVTETASDSNLTGHGITDDADNTRVLDVYVVDSTTGTGAPTLTIQGYVLHNTADNAVVNADGSSQQDTKANGFLNDYETENLTLSKTVEGNQASRDEYFEFTVKISDAVAGTKYNVTGDFDPTTQVNAINTEAKTNPAEIVVGSDGTVTQTFWLQHNQNIVINGLAKNTQYDINENMTTLGDEGYTPTAAVTGDTKTGANEANNIAMAASTSLVQDTAIQADTTVAYTNTKRGVIPTGVVMAVAPFAVVTLLGGAGAASIVMKKRKKEDDED